MKYTDLKYLLVWLVPVFGFAGLYFHSWLSPGSFYLGFIIIPLLEFILPIDPSNEDAMVKSKRETNVYFDILLYLNLPVVYGLLAYFIYIIDSQTPNLLTLSGMILNMGIILGVLGINVAHELGHRNSRYAQISAQLLLLPSFYLHFTQVHNFWHHKYVATPLDPASAKKNESVYRFWFRSITGGIMKAFKIERRKLSDNNLQFMHWRNVLLWQLAVEVVFVTGLVLIFGWLVMISVMLAAIISIVLLETINYIEHYGLRRTELHKGRYETVGDAHSWNSDHLLGRIFLYELTRHPFHHEKTSVKYQNLDSHGNSPQLPYGYPASMLLSLIPWAWFHKMNRLLPNNHFGS